MEEDRPRARDSVENLLCFRDAGNAADAGEIDGCTETKACGASGETGRHSPDREISLPQ